MTCAVRAAARSRLARIAQPWSRAPPHSITSSARTTSAGGNVRPSASVPRHQVGVRANHQTLDALLHHGFKGAVDLACRAGVENDDLYPG
jgi:hypothetical protein